LDVLFRFSEMAAYIALAVFIPAQDAGISLPFSIIAGSTMHQIVAVGCTFISTIRKWAQQQDTTLATMWSPNSPWARNYAISMLLQSSLAMAYVIDLSFKDGQRSRFDDRLLAVCLLMGCCRFIWAWRLSVVGSTIYTIVETFVAGAVNQMLFITFMLLMSFIMALMVLSRLHTMGLAAYAFRAVIFGDGDGFSDIGMDISHDTVFGGKNTDGVLVAFVVFGAFFFNVIVLNIIIAIYGHEYEKSQQNTPSQFMLGRADYCVKAILSSYMIPWKGETFNRCLILAASISIIISLVLGSSPVYVSGVYMWLSAVLFAVGVTLMRMALIQCDWFSPEGQDSEDHQRFLWVCHSRDWNKTEQDVGMEDRMDEMQEKMDENMDRMESKLGKVDDKLGQIFNALQLQDLSKLKKTSKSK